MMRRIYAEAFLGFLGAVGLFQAVFFCRFAH